MSKLKQTRGGKERAGPFPASGLQAKPNAKLPDHRIFRISWSSHAMVLNKNKKNRLNKAVAAEMTHDIRIQSERLRSGWDRIECKNATARRAKTVNRANHYNRFFFTELLRVQHCVVLAGLGEHIPDYSWNLWRGQRWNRQPTLLVSLVDKYETDSSIFVLGFFITQRWPTSEELEFIWMKTPLHGG